MIKVHNMEFEYFDRDAEGNLTEMIGAIRGIHFDAEKGAFVALCGRNGSGKSTFAKVVNRLLVPVEGTVEVDGLDALDEENKFEVRRRVGMVFQNPENQIVGSVVREDCAFGAENFGISRDELVKRVDNALSLVGLSHKADCRVEELSGGEKQKLAIAGALAMGTKCLILDEATSMLDEASARDILALIRKLNEKEGITVILITHDMEEALLAGEICIFDHGRIALRGRKQELFHLPERINSLGLELPEVVQMAQGLRMRGCISTDEVYSVNDLVALLKKERPYAFLKQKAKPVYEIDKIAVNPKHAILFDDVSFAYGKGEKPLFEHLSFSVGRGEYVALTGATGTGKSTLLRMIPGLLKPTAGSIYIDGADVYDRATDLRSLRKKIGFLFQYPEQQLFARNVYEDVVFGPRNLGVSEVEAEKRAYSCIELVGLSQEVYDLPYTKLSGGERRRVALAGVLAMQPDYLIMDEPFAGLDPEGRQTMQNLIYALNKDADITILMATHELSDVLARADRVINLDEALTEGNPASVFCKAYAEGNENVPFVSRFLTELRAQGMEIDPSVRTMKEGIDRIAGCLRR